LRATTITGSLRTEGWIGAIEADSVSGDLAFSGPLGMVTAEVVSGGIEINSPVIEDVDLAAVSGGISIRGNLGVAGELVAESHSGSISLALPANADARVRAASLAGRIDDTLSQVEAAHDNRRQRDFTLGRGRGRINLNTFSGSVRLEQVPPPV
jgi:DUF4097 and DUF4098 domain-containing protein YvlB